MPSENEPQAGEEVTIAIPLISTEFRLVQLDEFTLGLLSDNPVVRVLSPIDRSQAVDLGSALLKGAEKLQRRPQPSGLEVVEGLVTP